MDTILGQDSFTATDGTALTDHTPDVGETWINANLFSPPTVLQIASNMLAIDLDEGVYTDYYYLDTEDIADGYVQAVWSLFSASRWGVLVARLNPDTGDAIILFPKTTDTFTIVDTSTTNSEDISDMPWTGTPLIRMEFEGEDIRVYYDGELKGTLSSFTTLTTGKCGVRGYFLPV